MTVLIRQYDDDGYYDIAKGKGAVYVSDHGVYPEQLDLSAKRYRIKDYTDGDLVPWCNTSSADPAWDGTYPQYMGPHHFRAPVGPLSINGVPLYETKTQLCLDWCIWTLKVFCGKGADQGGFYYWSET